MRRVTTHRRAVFLDKDGTLVENVPFNVDPAKVRLTPNALEGARRLHRAGYALVVVSNQSGVARGRFREEELAGVQTRLRQLLSEGDVPLEGFYYCPHHPDGSIKRYAIACDCRKPEPGLVLRAAAELGLDLAASWLVGDILDDIEAGHRAGCRAVLVDRGSETEWRLSPLRLPDGMAVDLGDAATQIVERSRQGNRRTCGVFLGGSR